MTIFTRTFALGVADRAVRSFCQGALVGFGAAQLDSSQPFNALQFSGWLAIAGFGLGMALMSVLTSVATGIVRADGSISATEVPAGKVVAQETSSGLVVAGDRHPSPTGTPVWVEENPDLGKPDEPADDQLDGLEPPPGFDDGSAPAEATLS